MRKSTLLLLSILLLANVSVQIFASEGDERLSGKSKFVLFDFDNRKPMNSLSGQTGVFDGDPEDAEAFCRMGYAKDTDLNKEGYVLKLSYDVDSSKPAFNGFWTKLNNADLSKFKAISIKIKGDAEKGFSDIFKIEVKDKSRKIEYIVEGIQDQWNNIIIPFDEFDGDVAALDWENMTEFVIVFEDWRLKTKEGRYYIDEISFIPKSGSAKADTNSDTKWKKK